VNAVAVLYVNAYLEELRTNAAKPRTAPLVAKRSLRERLASFAATVRGVGSDGSPVVPQLKDYPYGG
jgi:hypothetical protein